MGELVLFHENDNHFNLIISRDSDLATLGSLSHRFRIGPKESVDNKKDKIEIKKVDTKHDNAQIKNLEKELIKTKEDHDKVKNNYIQCEKELRNKTEEVEILKLEINDLKELLKLKDKLLEGEMRKCNNCELKTTYTDWLKNHLENEHKNHDKSCRKRESRIQPGMSLKGHMDQIDESKKNDDPEKVKKCTKCDFLTNSIVWMDKHMKLVHNKIELL